MRRIGVSEWAGAVLRGRRVTQRPQARRSAAAADRIQNERPSTAGAGQRVKACEPAGAQRRQSDAARPAHLLVLLACFALAGYAGSFLLGDPALPRVLAWFVGAAVVHDLLLFPLYALVDRALGRLPRPRVPLVNHVRVPLLGAGLTFLLFLPGIVRQGEATHLAATGLDQAPYLGRWLALVAAMVALSALVYVVRLFTTR
jgi:hypothetical protein